MGREDTRAGVTISTGRADLGGIAPGVTTGGIYGAVIGTYGVIFGAVKGTYATGSTWGRGRAEGGIVGTPIG